MQVKIIFFLSILVLLLSVSAHAQKKLIEDPGKEAGYVSFAAKPILSQPGLKPGSGETEDSTDTSPSTLPDYTNDPQDQSVKTEDRAARLPTSDFGIMKIDLGDNKLMNFRLISYKNLPLIGFQPAFRDGRKTTAEEEFKEMVSKPNFIHDNEMLLNDDLVNYAAYTDLLNVYRAGNELLTYRRSPAKENDDNSLRAGYANKVLYGAAIVLVNNSLYNDFFCRKRFAANELNFKCQERTRRHFADRTALRMYFGGWGGYNASDTEKEEAYKRFELSAAEKSIVNAAKKIPKTAYLQITIQPVSYDSEKQGLSCYVGYWNSTYPFINTQRFSLEDKRVNQDSSKLFFKTPYEKASQFAIQFPQMANMSDADKSKIKVRYKKAYALVKIEFLQSFNWNQDSDQHKSVFKYKIIDPQIEIFEDEALLKKAGVAVFENF